MSAFATLVRATRAPSLFAGALPALVLTALAAAEGGPVHWDRFALTFLGLIALQAGVNVVNDLFDDASGLDADPAFAKNAFPLGSRVIQSGVLTRRGMWALAAGCFGVGLACGLALDRFYPGHVVLMIGAAGFLFGFFYTAPPFKLAYYGVGEPVIFLLFGPLAGLGTYYVQTGTFTLPASLLSCVVGLLDTAILFLHHFPQRDADAKHGKRTPIVRLGAQGAARLVPWLLALPFALVIASVAFRAVSPAALAFLAAAPLALRASRTALAQAGDARGMTVAFGQTMGFALGGGLALASGLAVASLL
ncbi:MAG TPA: prenyltransferase [Myxococcota bacterium]